LAACKRTHAGERAKMDPAPAASAFTLSGEFFALPLPAGWRAHPDQQKMQNLGAVTRRAR
jgi:hypothetical protein